MILLPPPDSRPLGRLVLDCFPFCHELDLLEIRLRTLADVVDWFVLAESNVTHSGQPKPLWFDRNRERFSRWLSRIRHVVVRDTPDGPDPWARERHQRDALVRGFPRLRPQDVLLSCDLDEIPNPTAIARYSPGRGPLALEMFHSFGFLNREVVRNRPWSRGRILSFGSLQGRTLAELRDRTDLPVMSNAGWHFSYCGGPDTVCYKLGAFAHARDPRWTPDRTRDLEVDDGFPRPVQHHQAELLKKGLLV